MSFFFFGFFPLSLSLSVFRRRRLFFRVSHSTYIRCSSQIETKHDFEIAKALSFFTSFARGERQKEQQRRKEEEKKTLLALLSVLLLVSKLSLVKSEKTKSASSSVPLAGLHLPF